METKKRGNRTKSILQNWQVIALLLILFDLVVAAGAYFIALWLRFDCSFMEIPPQFFMAWLKFAPLYALISIFVLWRMRLYQSIWKFAGIQELEKITISAFLLGLIHTVLMPLFFEKMPIPYYVVGIAIQYILTVFVRFAYRFILLEHRKKNRILQKENEKRVMLIGAGAAGKMLLRDLHSSDEHTDRIYCIIDDDPNKWGRVIDDVPIVGGRDDILFNVKRYHIDKIFLTIPAASAEQRRDILAICKETKCELKNLPSAYRYISNEKITAKSVIDVNIEDLLGREPAKVNMDEIYEAILGKVILVTGGGGSIGSELCRQIAQHKPKQLIIFDIYENNAHAIGLELKDKHPDLNLEVLIGSVRDSKRVNQIFEKYRPDVVYHAAAHKHVPLMEDSPCESIKNNAIGTYKTAYAAMMYGCKRFVLISTDKAVNPTNIMGASKRICEMIIQSFDRKIRDGKAGDLYPIHLHMQDEDESVQELTQDVNKSETDFVAVRFGNVLGSNGSVIPRFQEQIAKGGPVTVTHPDIIRYFMTIPEAAMLVLQAGVYADGGEIFVLDMGSPVKIDTLARNLIRLSGLKPDVDIKIAYTGLRAGEKLYEEKLMSEEGLRKTPNQLIHIGSPIPFDTDEFLGQLQILMNAAYDGEENRIRDLVAEVVPTYHPAGEEDAEMMDEVYHSQLASTEEGALSL